MEKRWTYGALLLVLLLALGCKRDKVQANTSNYPDEIAAILQQTCSASGCHTSQSAEGAAGLNLESWESLFKGSRGGSPVVPFSPDFSYLLYSVNSDSSLGPVLLPTMPVNQTPITSQEYYAIWHWINEGCPSASGEQPFPSDPNRKKYYVGHNECDEVAVFDAESRQVMRMIEVGNRPGQVEYMFDIQVSPDKKDWYVVFFNTNTHIERYSTLTDEKVAEIDLGNYGWGNIAISPDSKWGFVSNDLTFKLAVVNLDQNAMVGTPLEFTSEVRGPVVHPIHQQVFLTEHLQSALVTLDYDNNGNLSNQQSIDLVQGTPPSIPGELWPLEVFFMPDGSKYFVSCSHSNEVRVFDGATNGLLEVIALPAGPSRMEWSAVTGRLFVVCMMDNASWGGNPAKLGSINVVNTSTHQLERTIYSGFQPYGIAVDDANGVLVVANRNTDPNGPDPHHESPCGDRNGYMTLINLNSLELVQDYKPELSVDPIIVTPK